MNMRTVIEHARASLMKSGCSAVESDVLIKMAMESPPRGASRAEAVTAIGLAMTMNPHARHDLLALADLTKEDRERVQEIAAFEREQMPRFNVGYPHCIEELFEQLRSLLVGLWPHSHDSCISGALMVGITEAGERWTLNPFAIVKCMRETAEADRTMRYGHGR